MTTIAYKDGIIAYDGQTTIGDIILRSDTDKCQVVDGVYFFLSGIMSDFDELISCYLEGETDCSARVTAFVIDSGEVYVVSTDEDEGLWRDVMDTHYAIGSGKEFALAAMDMGATAEQAVKIAAGRDIYTGGKIRKVKVRK